VNARECADMIIGARPDVLRAKGIASQICYPGAAHKAATEFTTDMISAQATYVATSQAATTKATATACKRRIDNEAAAQDCEC
jgi:hypothetical protein